MIYANMGISKQLRCSETQTMNRENLQTTLLHDAMSVRTTAFYAPKQRIGLSRHLNQ